MTMYIHNKDIIVQWNSVKNEILKEKRGVSFEQVEEAIRKGNILRTIDHPNQLKYPDQKQLHIIINSYVYVIPYVITKYPNTIYLKTIYASRKATKEFKQKE
jgi:uncharacterized DUF497 family protein